MKNERIVIIGDSYSTFEGYIPQGYATYYSRQTSVNTVDKTWWKLLEKETKSKIILNSSWSGSTICNTGYNGDCSETSSFLHRVDVLEKEGFFEKEIDRVFVFGGTNDSWTGNELGEIIYSDWAKEDLFLVLPGMSCLLNKLARLVGKDKIIVIINSDINEQIITKYAEICEHQGISYIKLANIDKVDGHPTVLGMTQIKEQILAEI